MSQDKAPDPTRIEQSKAPQKDEGEAAIASWLGALGMDMAHPQLAQTPARVWECWSKDLLNGYQMDASALLEERFPVTQPGLVILRDIQLHGICPHHLLPFTGRAHLAYLPKDAVVGFSRLADLVQCFARRLALQETITQQIAQALIDELGAEGAGCVIEAQHMCMTLRAPEHHRSTITTSSFLGSFAEAPAWQQVLLRA